MTKILIGAALGCLAIILAGINRGFDISDEGLHILLANPLQENKAGIFNYDLFFKAFFRLTGHTFSILELRLIRLISYIIAAFALAGFWKNISGQSKIKAEIFWISCLGLFSGYAFLPPTLSYNSLAVVLCCFWLFFMTREQKTFTTIVLLGLLLALLVYVKISLALIFFPFTFLILIFWQKVKPTYTLGLILPLIFLELLFGIALGENAWLRLQEGIPLNTQRNGYQFALMLKSIAVGGFWLVLTAFLFFGIAHFRKSRSSPYTTMKLVAAYALILIGFLTHITDEWNHLILLAWAGLFGYQAGLGTFRITKTNVWILLLILFPFILHFGSNVYWLRIGIQYLVFWVLAASWIFREIRGEVLLGSALLMIFLVFNGIWWHPFGHDKPLWTHKLEWKMNDGTTLYLSPDLVNLAIEIKEFNFQYSHSQVLTAYRIPGLACLTGTTIPLSPSLWEKSQLSALFTKKPEVMIYNSFDKLPEDWIFENKRELGVFRGDSLQLLWD